MRWWRVIQLVLALGTVPVSSVAQQQFTLRDCIDRALAENLVLRDQQIAVHIAQENLKQSKLDFLPSVNATWDWRRVYGTTFDFVQFRRLNEATSFSAPGITANLVLFDGLAKYYTLKQNQALLNASQQSQARLTNDLLTTLMALYLQLVVDRANLQVLESRLALFQAQRERTEILYNAEAATEADLKTLEAQVGLEEVNRISQQNRIAQDELQLAQLLQLDPLAPVEFIAPEDVPEDALAEPIAPLAEVLGYALVHMPEIAEAEANIQAAGYAAKVAKAGRMPVLTLSGGLNSNYSSNGGIPVVDSVDIAGVTFPQTVGLERTAYFQQLSDNFSQFVGFTLSVPILNGWQVNRAVSVAHFNEQRSRLALQTAQNTLTQTVQTAHLDATAAQARYQALRKQVEAARTAFSLTEARFNAGATDFFTYRDALNTQTESELQLQQAKFDLLFKRKIVDFYAGKPLDL